MTLFRKYSLFIVLLGLLIVGCDQWDEHNKINDGTLNISLAETIKSKPELSTFADYLESTGYMEVLASSKMFTVWAPDNDALQSLSATIKDNPEQLKEFVGNHISNQEYLTQSSSIAVRVKMLSGKNLLWSNSTMDGIELTASDQLTKNGIIHTISQSLLPKPNTWKLLQDSYSAWSETAYLTSLNYLKFDPSTAVQIGIDPATAKPIYEEGTGYIEKNVFFDSVANLKDEDAQYTLILIADTTFNRERNKLKPYFATVTGNQDSTTSMSNFHLVKDMAVQGVVLPDQLPAFLLSKFNVKMPIDKSGIIQSHITSNGIVYVMNRMNFSLREKFPPIRIQGESPFYSISRSDRNQNVHRRYRSWADGTFDMRVYDEANAGGHAQIFVSYRVPKLYSTNYRVYWRTVNDFLDTLVNTAVFSQKLVIDARTNLGITSTGTFLPVISLPGKDFGYVKVNRIKATPASQNAARLLGTYQHGYFFKPTNLYLIATNSTDRTLNAIEVDYFELVPIIP